MISERMGFEPMKYKIQNNLANCRFNHSAISPKIYFLLRVMGLEPILSVWKTGRLPINEYSFFLIRWYKIQKFKIGWRGIRTPDTLNMYVGFQNQYLQPLGHSSLFFFREGVIRTHDLLFPKQPRYLYATPRI